MDRFTIGVNNVGLTDFFVKKSPWVLHYETGGCNGCAIELVAALTPRFDVERFGILKKATPRHADILAVTGPVTRHTKERLERIHEQMPEPKAVIGIGSCPTTCNLYDKCYNTVGPLDEVIPTASFVPGCPPKPEAIIDGVVKTLDL